MVKRFFEELRETLRHEQKQRFWSKAFQIGRHSFLSPFCFPKLYDAETIRALLNALLQANLNLLSLRFVLGFFCTPFYVCHVWMNFAWQWKVRWNAQRMCALWCNVIILCVQYRVSKSRPSLFCFFSFEIKLRPSVSFSIDFAVGVISPKIKSFSSSVSLKTQKWRKGNACENQSCSCSSLLKYRMLILARSPTVPRA